jgi:transposase
VFVTWSVVRRPGGGKSSSRVPAATDDELERLRRRVSELELENEKLRHEKSQLEDKIKAISREAFRQAAPFRRRDRLRSKAPKKPGRRAGHPGARRPDPKQVDERVEAPLSRCPHCGGRVTDLRPIKQTVEDIPAVRPVVTEIVTYRGTCADCGPVRSTHPRQVSMATGAAGVHVGPRAAALATDLNKRLGIPAAKTCAVLNEHFSLKLTPGGLVHLEARLARRLMPTYQELAALIRRSPVAHADETSWWVGGPGYWLWVFTNLQFTFYRVDRSRGRDVVESVLGDPYSGVLVSDCLSAYEHLTCRQQKCYAHHFKAIARAAEEYPKSSFLAEARMLLKSALAVHSLRDRVPIQKYIDLVGRLESWADRLLDPAVTTDHPKIAKRLRKRRRHLFTFLHHRGVDATNNAAERALRPAVVARKVSCGNRTEQGKNTWQVLASIAATCSQQQRSFTKLVEKAVLVGAPTPSLKCRPERPRAPTDAR